MARLIDVALASLDGYIEDSDGGFDWAEPDDKVHPFVNDLGREVGTHLFGRRMYETMVGWETEPACAAHSPVARDFAVGGPGLAAHAIRAGLIDECHVFVTPVPVGGGNARFPQDVRVELELTDERRFSNGMVCLRYGRRP